MLTQLSDVLGKLVNVLGGTRPSAAPPAGSPDTLKGFTVTGDAAEQGVLAGALTKIGGSTIGASLLTAARDKGIVLDIADDAEFDKVTQGKAATAAAVYYLGPGDVRTVVLRASQLNSGGADNVTHMLTHELIHAVQSLDGEYAQGTYAKAIGAQAAGLSADQLETGMTLMREAGAEFVAGAIDAQLADPAGFASVAADKDRLKRNMDSSADRSWKTVNEGGYNPRGYQLPQYISPTARAILDAGVSQ